MEEPLFFEDRDGFGSDGEELSDQPEKDAPGEQKQEVYRGKQTKRERKPVWVDDDDEQTTVNISKVKRRRKLRHAVGEDQISGVEYSKRIHDFYSSRTAAGAHMTADWARLPSERSRKKGSKEDTESADSEESDDELGASGRVKDLLRSTAKALKRSNDASVGEDASKVSLQSNILNIRQLRNANAEDPSNAEARCVEFHPSGQLLLTAGLDKTLRIFQVDGEQNAKVQGIHLKNFPIHTAKFTGGGTQVTAAGRRRFFQVLDMNTGTTARIQTLSNHEERSWERFEVSADGSTLAFLGQHGKIVLLSNSAKREIGQLRLNDRVANVAFAAEGGNEHHVYASSTDGTVYLWDTRRMACLDRHKDEGAVHSTSLAISTSNYALGSDSGVVNVYPLSSMGNQAGRSSFGLRTEKPKKTFLNLTTAIDNIAFNCDGRLMAFSSHDKKNAIRIAHLGSMTVYSNWPSMRANLRRACSLKFSPRSGYLAVGNDKGDVQLLRLPAYPVP